MHNWVNSRMKSIFDRLEKEVKEAKEESSAQANRARSHPLADQAALDSSSPWVASTDS